MEVELPKDSETRIYRVSGICVFLAVISFIVPRFVANPEGGFASGATAVLTLLIMIGATLLFSLYLLGVTLQKYSSLSVAAKIAGLGPSIVLALMLSGLFYFISY